MATTGIGVDVNEVKQRFQAATGQQNTASGNTWSNKPTYTYNENVSINRDAGAFNPDNIYQAALGRASDAGGASYWTEQFAKAKDPSKVYSDLIYAAKLNGEKINTAYDTWEEYQAAFKKKPQAPTLAPPSTYQPVTQQVTPQQTVAQQMNDLLSSNSDYMKRAQALAMENANKRGLLNSTMAAQAGTAAAIDAALPIATQDASTYSKQALVNQQYANTAAQFNADAANKFALTQYTTQADLQKTQQSNASKLLQTMSYDMSTGLTSLQSNTNFATAADKQAAIADYIGAQVALSKDAAAITGQNGMFKNLNAYVGG